MADPIDMSILRVDCIKDSMRFHFKVLPFGLHRAPASFQRLMNQVLQGLSFTAAYLDDIVVYSDTWDQHLQHLQKVLGHLQKAGLTVNPRKCAVAKTETEYLGFVISNGVLRPQVGKVRAVEECPMPHTRKQLHSFLGMSGFYNKFFHNFSTRTVVLTDMVGSQSSNQLQWTREVEAAFQDIWRALNTSPVLFNPDFDQPFILQTDASDRGIGAVLLQGPPRLTASHCILQSQTLSQRSMLNYGERMSSCKMGSEFPDVLPPGQGVYVRN